MKNFKKILVFFVLAIAIVAVVGCKKKNETQQPTDVPNEVIPAISLPDELKATVTVNVGDEVDLSKISVTESALLEFSSSDNSVVKIEGLKAQALKAGEATITVVAKEYPTVKATIKVVVKDDGTEPHTHSFGPWTVVNPATCQEEGLEERVCSCGEKETRTIEKSDHDLKLVELVPATLTTLGVMEHYECSVCGKLFDGNKEEVKEEDLYFEGKVAKYVSEPLLGVLNGFGEVQIYDDSDVIDGGDIVGYVFGIDETGKIIFASYYGDGYGGPSDGFYHDGTYAWEAGKVCGIFDIDPLFQPWPATTTYNGEVVNAWTLYEIKAPKGGYVISIKRGTHNDFIEALTGDKEFMSETDNTLFEETVSDGALNDVRISVTKGIKNASFVAYYEPSLTLALNSASDLSIYNDRAVISKADIDNMYVIGLVNNKIIYASRFGGDGYGGPSDGFYHDGSYELKPGTICGIFNVDAQFAPWPATAVVDGETVNAWTLFEVVVPRGGYIVAGKQEAIASFLVNLSGQEGFATETNNSLFESLPDGALNEEFGFEILEGKESACLYAEKYKTGIEFGGTNSGKFDLQEDGTYKATVTLAQWNFVTITKYGEQGEAIEIWYDNTKFSGDVTAEDVIGAQWDYRLYHEDTKKLYNCLGREMTYDLIYNPQTNELVVKCHPLQEFALEVTGDAEAKFVKNDSGKLEATVTLNLWKSIQFKATNEFGLSNTLWYDNTTFAGTITASDVYNSDNTVNLYHELDGEGKDTYRFYNGYADGMTYHFVYDIESKTMTVSVIYDEYYGYEGKFYQEDVEAKFDGAQAEIILKFGQWNSVKFFKFNSDGTKTYLFYDNARITGQVTGAEVEGADWTENLYHEGTDKAFYCCVDTNPSYKFTIDFEAKTLNVSLLNEPMLSLQGSYQETVLGKDGVFEATFELNIWNKVALVYADAEGTETPVWYDNTAISGYVTDAETTGADWTEKLYHEGEEKAFFCCVNGPTKYHLVYDSINKTLVVEVVFPEYVTYQINGGDKVKFEQDGDLYSARFALPIWGNVALEFSNSKNEKTTIWYDNTTFSGKVTAVDVEGADWTSNLYHEGTDKKLYACEGNNYLLEYNAVEKTLVVTVLTEPQLEIQGSITTVAKASDDGKFYLEFTLQQWNFVSFVYTDDRGNEKTLWYDNTTLSGKVTGADVSGADWTENLYHEGDNKDLYCCVSGGTKYLAIYDPTNNTLKIDLLADEVLTLDGSFKGTFEKNESGLFVGCVTLSQWGKLSLTFTNKFGETITIWYDNTTITGKVTSAETTGADWTDNLYHEGEEKAWLCCVDAKPTYVFTYDPINSTLVLEAKYDEYLLVGEEKVKKENGLFYFEKELAIWQSVSFTYVDEDGNSTVLWYDNTAISGLVTDASTTGADWTVKLYHEGEEKKLICCVDSKPVYTFTFDPVANTLVISAKPTLSYSGSVNGNFALNDGIYTAIFTLKQWNNVAFSFDSFDGNNVTLWYDSATISGLVTDSITEGADWTEKLYHEGEEKKFYCCVSECTYKVTYNPETRELKISQYTEPKLSYNGAQTGDFALNEAGLLEATVTLNQWNKIGFSYTDDEGNVTDLWYDNTTFAGKVTSVEAEGCDWTDNLFHEGIDKQLLCYVGGTTYVFTYDLSNKKLTVSIYVPESSGTGNYFVFGDGTKIEINDGVTVYSASDTNIALGEYTIAVDANGKIIYASRTSSGYGGPGDGFYHDGTYQVVPGSVCGIFDLDSQFAPWPATAVVDGNTVNAWTLYKVVCPTGCHIITGSQSAMSDLVKKVCSIATFDESNNALFENGFEDGSIIITIGFEFND